MSKGIIETTAGAAAITAGALLTGGATAFIFGPIMFTGAQAAQFLIAAGIGMSLSGVGTLLSKGAMSGFATTLRDPVAPWKIKYGRVRTGGNIVVIPQSEWAPAGGSNPARPG